MAIMKVVAGCNGNLKMGVVGGWGVLAYAYH